MDTFVGLLGPLTRIIQPKVFGIEHVPARNALLVGNHTLFGLLDVPFMLAELWQRERVAVRSLGEHAHYRFPIWRDLLARYGMVRGTRANCGELMRRGENVLVFPGGAREVNKRKGEKYTLLWKERVGFARLAIEHGTAIVPFAAVGAEEMLDIVVDTANPLLAPLAQIFERALGWPMQPIVRGIGVTPLPRPQRLYFWFGEPIPTSAVAGRHAEDDVVRAVRDEVKGAIEHGLEFLLAARERDPRRGLLPRLAAGPDD